MNAAVCPPAPFHRGEGWFSAWRAAYSTGGEVIVGGLPMVREAARIGPLRYRRLRSQTNLQTARFECGDPPPAAMLRGPGIDLVELDYVPEGSRLLAAYPDATVEPRARVPITDCDDADRWFAARSKRERQRLRRLDRDCALRFAIDRGEHDPDALLARLLDLEARGWKGRDGTAIRDDANDTAFYTRLTHAAAKSGALRIALLLDGDEVAAFEYGILSGDRLFVLKASYDEAHAEGSIGHVLALRHIRACCADAGIACYDVCGNGMTPAPHTLRFSDRTETLYRIRLYAASPRARLVRAAFAARRAAKRLRDWMRR